MAIFLEMAELDARKIAAEAALAQLESHQRTRASELGSVGNLGPSPSTSPPRARPSHQRNPSPWTDVAARLMQLFQMQQTRCGPTPRGST
jgi:hypothetical protein